MPNKTLSNSESVVVPVELIERKIYLIRGHKVMLDADLAELYGVTTGRLNEAVKRNRHRFPEDFMIQLTLEEGRSVLVLRSQIAILKRGRHLKYAPYVFTEQGVAMLSSVLNSERAVQVNIAIMRAFVKLREVMTTHKHLAYKIDSLERKYADHDEDIQVIFTAIKKLLEPPPLPPKRRIGFTSQDEPEPTE
jgi:hypothetical protein